jgi:hypothetical protein
MSTGAFELDLDMSTLKEAWATLNLSTPHRPVLHLGVSTPQRPELHIDLFTLQRPVLLDVFTLQRPWLHLDLSTLQKPLLHMDVSTPQGARTAPGLVYTTKDCAAPTGVYTTGAWGVSGCVPLDSIRETRSSTPVHLQYFEILTHAECKLKIGLRILSVH